MAIWIFWSDNIDRAITLFIRNCFDLTVLIPNLSNQFEITSIEVGNISKKNNFNPYPWIFGTIPGRFFWKKKPRIIAGDVTFGTYKIKIICADRVSVGLSYDANLKWHMPICLERFRAKQKYMPFFGTVTERAFRKKIPKHRNIYKYIL